MRSPSPSLAATLVRIALPLLALVVTLPASAQIKSPGKHTPYAAELEPHLVWLWDGEYDNDDGIGLGFRASIPVIDNGPVNTINNNFAITFGLDYAHFGDDCGPIDCNSDEFWVPIAAQWNFFLTPAISVFPELGLGLQHARFNWEGAAVCRNLGGGVRVCDDDDTDTDLELVLWLGARFGLSDSVALTLRLGVPSLLFGVSILM